MKIWELSIAIDDYNQYSTYTIALFQNIPTIEGILSLPEDNGFPRPKQIGKSLKESLEILVREGTLAECSATGGGHIWYLSEVEVY